MKKALLTSLQILFLVLLAAAVVNAEPAKAKEPKAPRKKYAEKGTYEFGLSGSFAKPSDGPTAVSFGPYVSYFIEDSFHAGTTFTMEYLDGYKKGTASLKPRLFLPLRGASVPNSAIPSKLRTGFSWTHRFSFFLQEQKGSGCSTFPFQTQLAGFPTRWLLCRVLSKQA